MARLDRLATLYFFRPLQRLRLAPKSGIPILMYHSISADAEQKRHPYFWTATTPAIFAEHMRLLHEQNYLTVSLEEAVQRLDAPGHSSDKPVVLTFDDGYLDFYTDAFPVLSKYGFGATVFLPTAYIGDTTRRFKGNDCLTWGQIRELQTAGIRFGSHTVTHPQLTTLKTQAIRDELRDSKETIEDKLGCPVTSFAYPFALPEGGHAFTHRLRTMLEEAGYQAGVSTRIGTADRTDDKFFARRLPVNSGDDSRFFAAKLVGAYDWLQTLQYAWKVRPSFLYPGAQSREVTAKAAKSL